MDDKRWEEILKSRRQNKYFGIICIIFAILMLFFALRNFGWMFEFIAVVVNLYYWFDIEQLLEDSHAIGKKTRIFLIALGVCFELASIIFVFVNVDYLLIMFAVASSGYLGFKVYCVLHRDLKNKDLKFSVSLLAIGLGIVAAALIQGFAPEYTIWLFLLIFALLYNLLHLIVRIIVQRQGTNRKI